MGGLNERANLSLGIDSLGGAGHLILKRKEKKMRAMSLKEEKKSLVSHAPISAGLCVTSVNEHFI